MCGMPGKAGRPLLRRYAVAVGYLLAFTVAEIVYVLLPAHDQAAYVSWASTSVDSVICSNSVEKSFQSPVVPIR